MTNHPNRAATYTVLNCHGDVQDKGVTLASAAQIVLNYDNNDYEIRPATDGDGFELWVSAASLSASTPSRALIKSRISSLNADEVLATADIYRQVVHNAEWWNHCSVELEDK